MNANLTAAKAAKNDEFYTQYADIEKEVSAYLEYDSGVFRGKTVLLPCDDPEWSNFTKYFLDRFDDYGIGKLVSTCIAPQARLKLPLFDGIGHGRYLARTRGKGTSTGILDGDGDFRSKELCQLRDEADMIITNPPFSLFREFIEWIRRGKDEDKKFLVIGNMNAITYKKIFPLIKENKMWLGNGFQASSAYFRTPKENMREYAEGVLDVNTRIVKFRNCCWFTNLEHGRRHEPLQLMTMAENKKYSRHKEVRGNDYRHYDNYDAIEVPFTDAIPADYDGVMGVPISFLDKYCPEQFEIVGATESEGKGFSNGLWKPESKVAQPMSNGKRIYKRIFIRHKHPTKIAPTHEYRS